MLRVFAALPWSLLFSVAVAAEQPRVLLERTEIDFGQISGDGPVHQEVRISNLGAAPLRIQRVELTPPLRLIDMRAQVAAGDTVTLRVVLHPAELVGRYTGRVIARTNDPVAPEIVLTVVADVVRPIVLLPHAEFFLLGVRGERAETSIEIVNNESGPLELETPQHSTVHFTSRLQPVERGRRYRLSIALRSDGPVGRLRENITVATSSKVVPVLTIPVHTLLRERVYTFPDSVDLGALPLSAIAADPGMLRRNAQVLMIYQSGGADFRVSATSDIPGISIHAERGQGGDRHQLTIQLDPLHATATRDIRGHVFIETNDAEFPRLRVPVTGTLLAL